MYVEPLCLHLGSFFPSKCMLPFWRACCGFGSLALLEIWDTFLPVVWLYIWYLRGTAVYCMHNVCRTLVFTFRFLFSSKMYSQVTTLVLPALRLPYCNFLLCFLLPSFSCFLSHPLFDFVLHIAPPFLSTRYAAAQRSTFNVYVSYFLLLNIWLFCMCVLPVVSLTVVCGCFPIFV